MCCAWVWKVERNRERVAPIFPLLVDSVLQLGIEGSNGHQDEYKLHLEVLS